MRYWELAELVPPSGPSGSSLRLVRLGGIEAADVEDVDKAFVAARNRFEAADAGELAFVGSGVLEVVAIDDFDGAPGAEGVAGEPDFAVSALADAPDQLVIGNVWRRVAHRLQRRAGQAELGFDVIARGGHAVCISVMARAV